MNSKIEKIICDDSINICKWYTKNNVELSIVKPPYVSEEDLNDKFLDKFQAIMKQISNVTRPGGVCCLILDEDKNLNETISIVPNQLLQLTNLNVKWKYWKKTEEIIWVKSSKTAVEDLNPSKDKIIITLDETPFSTIHILERFGSEFEYVDSKERITKLDLDEQTKNEWMDEFWYVQPKKKSKFQERIPKEILTRLIQIFSDKNDIVLDPFSGFGTTAIVCKKLFRNFLCFDINEKKINLSLKQLKINL